MLVVRVNRHQRREDKGGKESLVGDRGGDNGGEGIERLALEYAWSVGSEGQLDEAPRHAARDHRRLLSAYAHPAFDSLLTWFPPPGPPISDLIKPRTNPALYNFCSGQNCRANSSGEGASGARPAGKPRMGGMEGIKESSLK
jgi:hypothetical protein